MEKTSWEEKVKAVTHIITNPTDSPGLYSQVLIGTQIPCYLNWDYPPLLCPDSTAMMRWRFSRFLKRAPRFGIPATSWRSKCPYQLPPPLVWAKGVEEGGWGDEERRMYVRRRLARKRLGSDVNPLIPILLPNLLLISLLFWKDPFSIDDN